MIKEGFEPVTCGPCDRPQVFTSSMRWTRELLKAGRHRRVLLIAALLALAPDALVLADARPPALLAFAPDALVLADARSICPFGAGARRCSRPRTPCIGSFGAGAGSNIIKQCD